MADVVEVVVVALREVVEAVVVVLDVVEAAVTGKLKRPIVSLFQNTEKW